MPERGPTRTLNKPEEGYWAIRLVKNGPEVGAMITRIPHEPGEPSNILDTGPILYAEIDGRSVDPLRVWHTRGRPITEADYRFMCAMSAWARAHSPEEPAANPTAPVNLTNIPPVGPPNE